MGQKKKTLQSCQRIESITINMSTSELGTSTRDVMIDLLKNNETSSSSEFDGVFNVNDYSNFDMDNMSAAIRSETTSSSNRRLCAWCLFACCCGSVIVAALLIALGKAENVTGLNPFEVGKDAGHTQNRPLHQLRYQQTRQRSCSRRFKTAHQNPRGNLLRNQQSRRPRRHQRQVCRPRIQQRSLR